MIDTAPDVLGYWQQASAAARHEDAARFEHEIGVRLNGLHHDNRNALDYGCGGGAGMRELDERAWLPVGVDLVMQHDRFRVLRPEQLHELDAGSFGLVMSTSCFQHFPDAHYAHAVLAELRRLAAPRACGLVQVRYCNPGDPYDPADLPSAYDKRAMRAHAWRIDAFWKALTAAGFTPEAVDLEPWRQYAWYRFSG